MGKSQKIISSVLILTMFGALAVQANNFLLKSDIIQGKALQKTSIKAMDENTAKIHYDNLAFANKDFVISKEKQGESFNYVITDFETKNELCKFTSAYDMDLKNANANKNENLCAAAYAIFKVATSGGDPIAAILSVGGAIGALGEGTLIAIADLIATEGILAIPGIIGLLSASEAAVALGSAAAIA